MKKLVTTVHHNKGLTIIELIVSIALISIIMLFLLNLLSDLKHEDSYSDYAKENQVNRALIIKTIEERLLDIEQDDYITNITASYNSSSSNKLANIKFTFKKAGNIELEVKDDILNYIDPDSNLSEQYTIEKKQEESRFNLEGIELTVNSNTIKLKDTPIYTANLNDTSLCQKLKNVKLNSNLGGSSLETYNSDSGTGKTNNNLVACPKYLFFELKIPIVTDADDIDHLEDSKAIDDIVISFIGKRIQ